MPGRTNRWGLSTLGPGDQLASEDFKFTDEDRQLIDRLLAYAVEQHHHTGAPAVDNSPVVAPTLQLSTSGGAIASGARFYYRYTFVSPDGFETAPSPLSFVDTPRAIDSPVAPTPSYVSGSGSLQPGTYGYVLSAYTGASTLESKAVNSAMVTIPGRSASNEVSLVLPALPPGADGYNLYRKAPSGMYYLFLATIPSPAPLEVWVDDGSTTPDYDRTLPATNKTSNTNLITISLPGATPAVPAEYSWRLYRSADPNNWARSYLTELRWAGATPTMEYSFDDVGGSTFTGAPPPRAQVFHAPPKVDLATETSGVLPPSRVTTATQVALHVPGTVTVGDAQVTWLCDFDAARLVAVRAHLGPGSAPADQDVIIDVRVEDTGTGTFASVFDATFPTVPVGEEVGNPVTPAVTTLPVGGRVLIDVTQAGGGATPTDAELGVNLLLYVSQGAEYDDLPWTLP